jgi:LysR family transcriptional regulator AphB
LVADFLAAYPDVRIDLVLSNRRIDIIEEGFDLVIRIGALEDSNLIAKLLGNSQRNLYASPGYLALRGKPKMPKDLTDHDCLAMRDNQGQIRWSLQDSNGRANVTIVPRVEANDFPSLHQMALDGAGIGSLPTYLAAEMVRQGQLIRVLPAWSLPSVDFHALYPSHRGATPKVRAFLDFIGPRFAKAL